MEALVEFISDNPLYAVGIALLLLFLIFALIKKMVMVAIIAIILNIAYVYYLQDMAQDTYARAEARVGKAADKAADLFNEAGSLLGK